MSVSVEPPSEKYAWFPTGAQRDAANVSRLMQRLRCANYHELHRLSVTEPDRFWRAVRADLAIPFSADWSQVMDDSLGREWSTWFSGAELNVADACAHRWAHERPEDVATVWLTEDGDRSLLTWHEYSQQIIRFAEGLQAIGVKKGDTVGIYLPMCPAAAVAGLACAHLGTLMVPIFSGFGAPAVAARLTDAHARVLVTAAASTRRGETIPMLEVAEEAAAIAATVEHIIVWGEDGARAGQGHDVVGWNDLVKDATGHLPAVQVDSEAPFYIAYTSGTTGKPKGAVHVHGGFLLSIACEAAYQSDIRSGDRVLFVTDIGWLMGPWTFVGGGALGAAVIYLEGAPDYPAHRIWKTVENERVTMLGITPTLVRALSSREDPNAELSSLRLVTTTGELWNPKPYEWLNDKVCGSGRIPIVNISGGTEVGACFLSVTPSAPTKRCSVGFPALGRDVDVFDDHGWPLRDQVGELVCKRPWPGMTRGIWGDPVRYVETYWTRYDGVWTHGDWASIDQDGYWFLHGRSDETLNIAGKRIGPGELESPASDHPAVHEVAAIGVPHDIKGEVPVLYCVLHGGANVTERDVAQVVSDQLGKAFKPARVYFVSQLPRTRSSKIVRGAIRSKALGLPLGDLSGLENPEILDEIPVHVTG